MRERRKGGFPACFKGKESKGVRCSSIFPWYFGFSLALLWLSLFNDGAAESGDVPLVNDFFWIVLGLASLACSVVCRKTDAQARFPRSLCAFDMIAGLTAALSAPLLFSAFLDDELMLVVVAASAVATTWVLIRWGAMLAKLELAMLMRVLAGNALLLLSGKTLIGISAVSPIVELVLCAALPVVSVGALRGAQNVSEQHGHAFYSRERGKDLLFVALFILLFGVVLQLLDLLSRESSFSPLSCAVMLVFVCGVVAAVLAGKGCLDFCDAVRALLVATALGAFALVASSGLWHAAAFGVVQGIREITRFYFFAITADVAHHSDESPVFFFGACWFLGALARLPFIWMDETTLSSFAFGDGGANSFLLSVLLLILLIIMAYSLLKPPPGVRPPLSDSRPFLLSDQLESPKKETNLDRFAELLTERYGLTSRELDVARLICQGRGRSYIADTLYISDNTVKFHSKNLYRKIGIASKNELLDLFEEESWSR